MKRQYIIASILMVLLIFNGVASWSILNKVDGLDKDIARTERNISGVYDILNEIRAGQQYLRQDVRDIRNRAEETKEKVSGTVDLLNEVRDQIYFIRSDILKIKNYLRTGQKFYLED